MTDDPSASDYELDDTAILLLSALAQHWSRQTEIGRGIRIEATDLDLLNLIGMDRLLIGEAPRHQGELALVTMWRNG